MDLRNRIHIQRAHEHPYNISQSTLDSESFQRVDQIKPVIIGGSSAQILYKKPDATFKKAKSESKENVKQNNFMSDGGLKDRSTKYKDSTTFNKPTQKIQKSLSLNPDPNFTPQQISVYSVSVKGNDSQEYDKPLPKETPVILKNKMGISKEIKVCKEVKGKVEQRPMKKAKSEKRSVSVEVKKKVSSIPKKASEKITPIIEQSQPQAQVSQPKMLSMAAGYKNKPDPAEGQAMTNNYVSNKATLKLVNQRNQEGSKDSEHEDRPKKTPFIEASREKKVSQSKVYESERRVGVAPKTISDQSVNSNTPMNQRSKKNSRLNDQSTSSNAPSKTNSSSGKILSEQERIEIMEKLVKNKEEEIIREVQKEVLKKGKQTNGSIQKKLKVLSEKNMLENIDFENRNDETQAQGNLVQENLIDTNSNSNINEESNVIINHRGVRNLNLRNHSSSLGKAMLKPKIDTLEYLNKINMEANQNILVLNKTINTNPSKGVVNELNNSFRKCNSEEKKKKIVTAESKGTEIYDSDNNFLLSNPKSHKQKREDVALFMLKKKEKDKERAIKLERETNDRSLNILIELAKLNEKVKIRFHSQHGKSKKKKVKNDLYIGNRSKSQSNAAKSAKSDHSTVIDPNEYYYGILTSKKIIAPNIACKQTSTKSVDCTDSPLRRSIENLQDKKVIQGKGGITKEEFVEFLENHEHTIKSSQSPKFIDSKEASFSKDKSKTKEALKKIHQGFEKEQERYIVNAIDFSNEKFTQLKNKVLCTIQKTNYLLENSNLSDIVMKSSLREIENIYDQEKDNSHSNNNTITNKPDLTKQENIGQLSIQVPSTIDANNIASLNNKDNDNLYDFNERVDSEMDNHLPTEKEHDTISHQGTNLAQKEIPEQENPRLGSGSAFAHEKIDMNAVYNLYELIKYFNWKRVFSTLIQHYAEVTKVQRYEFGMEYLTAIIKKRPFIAVQNYVNYITYYYALNGLVAPIKRNALQQILSYSELRGRLYFFGKLLELIMKKRCLTLIYFYYVSLLNQEGEEEEENFNEEAENQQILMQQYYDKCKDSFTLFIRPHLYEAFHILVNYAKLCLPLSNSNSEQKKEIDLSQSRKIYSESPSSSKLWYNKNEDLEAEEFDRQVSNKSLERNNHSQRSREGSNNGINLSRLSNENSFMHEKMNTYLYESLSEKSIELYPNSFDSHRLHRIHELIKKQQEITGAVSNDESQYSQNQNLCPKSSDRSLKTDQGHKKGSLQLEANSNNHSFSYNNGQGNQKSGEENVNNISNKEISNSKVNEKNNLLLSKSNKFSNIDIAELNNSTDPVINLKQTQINNEGKDITASRQQQNLIMPSDFLIEKKHEEPKPQEREISNANVLVAIKKNEEEIIEEIDISDEKNNPAVKKVKERNIYKDKDKDTSGENAKNSDSYSNKYFEKLATVSEPDISADRDLTSDIDWGCQVSVPKSSGSLRDDHLKEKESISGADGQLQKLSPMHKETDQKIIQEEAHRTENSMTLEVKEDKSIHKSREDDHTQGNNQQDKKESDDGEYDLNEFQNEEDIPQGDDREDNILGIIRGESSQNPAGNLIYTNSKDSSQGLNSMKSRNQNEKKRTDGNKDNTDHAKEQNGSSNIDDTSHLNINNHSEIRIPGIVDPAICQVISKGGNDNEMLLNNNEKIVLDTEVLNNDKIEDKITIEVDGNATGNISELPSARECKSNKASEIGKITAENDCKSISSNAFVPSSIKSIESESEDFFKITGNNNNNKIFTINDGISQTSLVGENENLKEKLSKNITSTIQTIQDNNSSLNTVIKDTNISQNNRYEKENEDLKVLSHSFEEKKEHEIQINYENIAQDITNAILGDLLFSEIQDGKKYLIPKKTQKIEKIGEKMDTSLNFLNHSAGSINTSPSHKAGGFLNNPSAMNMIESACSGLNIPTTLNNSIFMKTMSELKKEVSLNLYNAKIAPKLIQNISRMVEKNYHLIYEEIKKPLVNSPEEVIQALIHRDSYLLKTSYKCAPANFNSNNLIDKKKILSEFDAVNRDIRAEDNVASDNYYDNILNECLLEAANELIMKERLYGDIGEPLPWSNRTRAVKFKYEDNEASKKKMREYLGKELTGMVNYKMGLISENHEHLDPDQLNQERERRLMMNIHKELNEIEDQWKTFEIEETQVKLELADLVVEQLLNEVVEILEHVQLSRRRSILYQYKSIFACEDIPRLSFQQYSTENDYDNINQ